VPAVTWHDFNPTSDDDHSCALCGVIASDDVVNLIAVQCPVPACEHPANEGAPCVFVMGDDGPECSYCEGRGSAGAAGVDDDEELADVEVDEAAVAALECDLQHTGDFQGVAM
jgi:hypothetical protein